MRFWNFIITANFLLLASLASGQTVNLSRMQRALGEGRIIYTDSLGKQEYRILTNILDTTIIDTATYLLQDTILVYYAGGTEFGRDTIRPASAGGATNFGSGTDGYYTVWSADTLADGRIYNSGSTVVIDGNGAAPNEVVVGNGVTTVRGLTYGTLSTANSLYLGGITTIPWRATIVAPGRGMSINTAGTFDTLNVDIGTGTDGYYPVWLNDTLVDGRIWNQSDTVLYIDGSGDAVGDIAISPTKTTIYRPLFQGLSAANTTHITGMTSTQLATIMAIGDGLSVSSGFAVDTLKVTAGAPAYAQLISNSSESISATTFTKFAPAAGWTEIESGTLDADGANDWINPTATMTAKVEFSANVYMDGGSFAGNVTFRIYKNGSFEAPISCSVGPFATDENKLMHLQAIVQLDPNDEIEVYYSLSTALGAGTMYVYAPTLNVVKL